MKGRAMVPGASNYRQRGERMPDNGTATDGACVVCGERWSVRYYPGDGRGPYCAEHFPKQD